MEEGSFEGEREGEGERTPGEAATTATATGTLSRSLLRIRAFADDFFVASFEFDHSLSVSCSLSSSESTCGHSTSGVEEHPDLGLDLLGLHRKERWCCCEMVCRTFYLSFFLSIESY